PTTTPLAARFRSPRRCASDCWPTAPPRAEAPPRRPAAPAPGSPHPPRAALAKIQKALWHLLGQLEPRRRYSLTRHISLATAPPPSSSRRPAYPRGVGLLRRRSDVRSRSPAAPAQKWRAREGRPSRLLRLLHFDAGRALAHPHEDDAVLAHRLHAQLVAVDVDLVAALGQAAEVVEDQSADRVVSLVAGQRDPVVLEIGDPYG